MLVVTGDITIDELHTVGGTPCPQELGLLTIANTGGGTANYQITGLPAWAELVNEDGEPVSAMGTLGMGEDLIVIVRFTCMNFGAVPEAGESRTVSGTLSVQGEDGDGNSIGSQSVSLTLEIRSPEEMS